MKGRLLLAIILTVYCLLFGANIFNITEDVSLAGAMESDAGARIDSVLRMFNKPVYNQHNAAASGVYGWVYNDIMFVGVAVAKVFTNNTQYLIIVIRALHFALGFAGVWACFVFISGLGVSKWLTFFATLAYLVNPSTGMYSYLLHPEISGSLFVFIALIFLQKYRVSGLPRHFSALFTALVVAALNKPPFFFPAFPVLYLAAEVYRGKHGLTLKDYIFSKVFVVHLLVMAAGAILIAAIIHPFAFLEFSRFLAFLQQLRGDMISLSIPESIKSWIPVILSDHYVLAGCLIGTMASVYFIRLGVKRLDFYGRLVITSTVFLCVYIVLVVTNNRIIFSPHYFYPALPFVLIILTVCAHLVLQSIRWRQHIVGSVKTTAGICLTIFFAQNAIWVSHFLILRSLYKHHTIYKLRDYIARNSEDFTFYDEKAKRYRFKKTLIDHVVAIPDSLYHPKIGKVVSDNVCNTFSCQVAAYRPDILILENEYQYADRKPILAYAAREGMRPVKTLYAEVNERFSAQQWFIDSHYLYREYWNIRNNPDFNIGLNYTVYARPGFAVRNQ